MRSWTEAACMGVATLCGYRLERRFKPRLKRPIPPGACLHVGCGDQPIDGHRGCDVRPHPRVDLVCSAWEVSQFCVGLEEIYSRRLLERLTFCEAQRTLCDWYAALAPNGILRIEVPNLEFSMKQLQRAVWSGEAMRDKFSDARWGLAGVFGWQSQCDPELSDYAPHYWDVHKSGYTIDALRSFLNEAGFQHVDIQRTGFTAAQNRRRQLDPFLSKNCHLVATAYKTALSVRRAA